jgi:hypothetical protein
MRQPRKIKQGSVAAAFKAYVEFCQRANVKFGAVAAIHPNRVAQNRRNALPVNQ